MRQIKIIVISLYIIILGFIVFGNTSVFGADAVYVQRQYGADFSDVFVNYQDLFDTELVLNKDKNKSSNGYAYFYDFMYTQDKFKFFNYFAYPVEPVSSDISGVRGRGWYVDIYAFIQSSNILSSSSSFSYADIENFVMPNIAGWQVDDRSIFFSGCNVWCWYRLAIYDDNTQVFYPHFEQSFQSAIPLSVLDYAHPIVTGNLINSTTNNGVNNTIVSQTNKINNSLSNQTQAIKQQTNAITSATQQQTNALLDTNDTGTDSMNVTDSTTDTSADLSGLFNQISSSFTDTSSETEKGFDLKLPNGDTHTFTLKANVLTSFLDSNPVLKAFYQAFFYVVFGGYVIFDFKKIINKLKEGNIDNVVGTSSPVDSVVGMSLK